MPSAIRIVGAREHNLKNITLELPRDRLVVLTGLSGSGKSTLAFDTIYAEGQRRYVESLSAYARQFLSLMRKPDVDSIEGLSPAISIEQKSTSRNPRSTVGTVTEIYDYLRLLFARIGVPHSPATGLPIEAQSVARMVDRIMTAWKGKRVHVLAPIVRGRKGEYRKELQELLRQGYQRVRADGVVHDLNDGLPKLARTTKHDIDVVVDRLVVKAGIEQRLADSLETALKLSDGLVFCFGVDTGRVETFSSRFACPVSGFTIEAIEPRLFSFNNPYGACAQCGGLGVRKSFDKELVIPDPGVSLAQGAVAPLRLGRFRRRYGQFLLSVARHFGIAPDTPWREIEAAQQELLLDGDGQTHDIRAAYEEDGHRYTVSTKFAGLLPLLERQYARGNAWLQEDLSRFMSDSPCDACLGARLKVEALAVKIAGLSISDVAAMPIDACLRWVGEIERGLNPQQKEIARRIVQEIEERLSFLQRVGLSYLTLARNAATLSGGEGQRIRLASQIGSGLTGVLYVLDEPSIGLHPRDNARLLATLETLRDLGNTVLVVEHDEETILKADYVVDMGPRAGRDGGEIVDCGKPSEVVAKGTGLTARYLRRELSIPIPSRRRRGNGSAIIVRGARAHNLASLTARFPLGSFICVTGVSGSGKSTLVIDTLYRACARWQRQGWGEGVALAASCDAIEGLEHIDKVVDINQSPIGRTPRSNPATYTGAWTPIREWYAGLPEARARGYGVGRFSFNTSDGGRCQACKGDGVLRIEMHFLADVYVECDACRGARFGRETLEVKWKGRSIADVLALTVDEAARLFRAIPAISRKLVTLQRVGLGYIRLGQQATTLSGGEAQRVRLSRELARVATGRTLYILDEPTTGLHFDDVRQLLEVLHTLAEGGNTVIVIEHNLDVVRTADWVLDLGPEGGDGGGRLVAEGTPEEVARHGSSHTGACLRGTLGVDAKK